MARQNVQHVCGYSNLESMLLVYDMWNLEDLCVTFRDGV